ncbi:MAG TPA: hypothetical protein VEW46_10150 [Pyrinomonadaceae bacterium]|nr:hypothetical protein [Pyrinomonadaceae bacterium]
MQKRSLLLVALIGIVLSHSVASHAQSEALATARTIAAINGSAPASITPTTAPVDLARAALAAQGGEKFKNVTSMVLIGTVDLFAPNSTQSLPGKFVIVIAGDKARLDIDARPAVSFKNVYNGQQSYSSMPGVSMPPMSKFGLPMLAKLDQPGYTVTALPDKKKQRGFRIADADGNATEFYVDATTGRVMTFLIPFNGYTFGTDISKTKDVEGVLVSYNFTQRLEMKQGAFFVEYSVKDVKLNQPLGDDVFVIPN